MSPTIAKEREREYVWSVALMCRRRAQYCGDVHSKRCPAADMRGRLTGDGLYRHQLQPRPQHPFHLASNTKKTTDTDLRRKRNEVSTYIGMITVAKREKYRSFVGKRKTLSFPHRPTIKSHCGRNTQRQVHFAEARRLRSNQSFCMPIPTKN